MRSSFENEFKRDNGDKVIIRVEFAEWLNNYRIVHVGLLLKRKRNIQYISCSDDYSYRALDTDGRKKYLLDKYLEVVTEEEIKETVMKAWENLKPVIENKDDLYKMV